MPRDYPFKLINTMPTIDERAKKPVEKRMFIVKVVTDISGSYTSEQEVEAENEASARTLAIQLGYEEAREDYIIDDLEFDSSVDSIEDEGLIEEDGTGADEF